MVTFPSRPSRSGRWVIFLMVPLMVIAFAALLILTPWPLSWSAPLFTQFGVQWKNMQGSLVQGLRFEELTLGKGPSMVTLRSVEMKMNLEILLFSQELHFFSLNAKNGTIPLPQEATVPPLLQNLQKLSLSFSSIPLKIDQFSIAEGRLLLNSGREAKLQDLKIKNLSLIASSSKFEWSELQLKTSLGHLKTKQGQLAPGDISLQGVRGFLDPGLLPDFLRKKIDLEGNVSLSNGTVEVPRPEDELRLLSGKISLSFSENQSHLKLRDLNLSEVFHFDYPFSIEEADLSVPFFEWSDANAWTKAWVEKLPKSQIKFGEEKLRYDLSCGCFHDSQGRTEMTVALDPGTQKPRLTWKIQEYLTEQSQLTPESIFSKKIWNLSPHQLSAAQKKRLKKITASTTLIHPPAPPETNQSLYADMKLLRKSRKNPEDKKVFEIIRRSARTDAPMAVLYFASLQSMTEKDCGPVNAWVGEITAKSHDPLMLGKSLAILSQCESNQKKKNQLIALAKNYLPKDPYIQALLHQVRVEQSTSKASDKKAEAYLRNKKTPSDLSVIVIDAFLNRSLELKKSKEALRWAQEKYRRTSSEEDLAVVQKLKSPLNPSRLPAASKSP